MQADFRRHWERLARMKHDPQATPPDYPAEFGFYDALGVQDKGQMLIQYGILPRAGGWDDQDESDRHDLLVYLSGLAYYEWFVGQEISNRTETYGERD